MSLSDPIEKVMTVEFTVARPGQRNDDLIALMKSKDLRQIPIVNGQGEVIDLKILVDLVQLPGRDNWCSSSWRAAKGSGSNP
jgi:CBS domain-containing protein